jgi:DNA-binding NtrC family response regulator
MACRVRLDFRVVLIVENVQELATSIRSLLLTAGVESIEIVRTPQLAIASLRSETELVLVDLDSGVRKEFDVITAARCSCPRVKVLAIGGACARSTAAEAIRRGADMFLEKPFSHKQLKASLLRLTTYDRFSVVCREQVGLRTLRDALTHVRLQMAEEALRKSSGSVRSAARLLSVDRAYVRRLRHPRSLRVGHAR